MINYKLKMEAAPFGQFYKTPAAGEYNPLENFFLSARGVNNLSVGCKFHLAFIINHLQFIIKKSTVPLAVGINAPKKRFRDSFEVSLGKVVLEKTWKQYTINLESQDLSSVIGGFCWVASKTANPGGLTFYLDDVYYE